MSRRLKNLCLMIVLITIQLCDAQLGSDTENNSEKLTSQESINHLGTAIGIIIGVFAVSVCLPFCIVFIVMCLVCRFGGVSPRSKEENGESTTTGLSGNLSTYATAVTIDKPQDSATRQTKPPGHSQASTACAEPAGKSSLKPIHSTPSTDTSQTPQPVIQPTLDVSNPLQIQSEATQEQEAASSTEPEESQYQQQTLYSLDTKLEDPIVACSEL